MIKKLSTFSFSYNDKTSYDSLVIGSQLHEEFSQKLQNTQTATQTQPQSNKASASARSTRSAAADISTSMLAPDSQMSTRAIRYCSVVNTFASA